MTETKMNVTLLAHTQLSDKFYDSFDEHNEFLEYTGNKLANLNATDGQAVALSAIRTCYSANKPSEIVAKEGAKYFGSKATDGKGGTEADRLIRQIVASKHVSTLEHLTYTFSVEGISRVLLAQLTRHRVGFSFSVQSQRYVRMGSDDKIGGFDCVVPDSIKDSTKSEEFIAGYNYDREDDEYYPLKKTLTASNVFDEIMDDLQSAYDRLRKLGIPAEDARAVLPQAAATNLVLTGNLRSLLDFYSKRKTGNGAQKEIADLAESLKDEVIVVEPWVKPFFEGEAE